MSTSYPFLTLTTVNISIIAPAKWITFVFSKLIRSLKLHFFPKPKKWRRARSASEIQRCGKLFFVLIIRRISTKRRGKGKRVCQVNEVKKDFTDNSLHFFFWSLQYLFCPLFQRLLLICLLVCCLCPQIWYVYLRLWKFTIETRTKLLVYFFPKTI